MEQDDKKPEKIDFIKSMKVLKLEPGDIIVLKSDQVLSMEMIKLLKDHVGKITETKVLILEPGLDIGVLRKKQSTHLGPWGDH